MAQRGSGAAWRRPAWPGVLLALTAVAILALPQAHAESLSFTGPAGAPQPLQLKKPPQAPARPAPGPASAFLPKPPRIPLLEGAPVPVSFSAALTDRAPPLSRGVTWRIYAADPDAEGRYPLVERSDQAQPTLKLKPGDYVITTSYGRVVAAQRVTIADATSHRFVLNAGGLRLGAVVGDKPLPDGLVSFSIYKPEPDRAGDGKLLVADVKAGQIVRLAEGSYHVVSRYGSANATVRANVRVEAGRLTDASMYHKAAAITLKLVNEPGGEALANTSWSILSANGESVQESVGAFPTHILAAGQYTVIARHEGHVYNREFSVQPGYDREVEVLARP